MSENILNTVLELGQKGEKIPLNLTYYLQNGINIHFDNYGCKRLPYICLESQGIKHLFLKTQKEEVGNTFYVYDVTGGYATACFGASNEIYKQILLEVSEHSRYLTDEIGDIGRSVLLNYLFGLGGIWADRFPQEKYHVSGRNSGSEGIELCLRLIIENQFDMHNLAVKKGRERRKRILSFEGAWHGWTGGILALLNRSYYKVGIPTLEHSGDFLFKYLPFGNIEILENYFKSFGHEIAGVIVEPILGDGGIIVPADGFLRRLSELCQEYEAILAADEVLTYAKTGQFFAMNDKEGVIPTNITVIGKSLGLGLISTSMVIAKRELTVRANGAVTTSDLRPTTCTIIKHGIQYIITNNLLEVSIPKGLKIRQDIKNKIIDKYPQVFTAIRGKGLINGVELTEPASRHMHDLRQHLIESGVYVEFMAGAGKVSKTTRYGFPVMRITPPLIITNDEIDEIVERIDAGIKRFIR